MVDCDPINTWYEGSVDCDTINECEEKAVDWDSTEDCDERLLGCEIGTPVAALTRGENSAASLSSPKCSGLLTDPGFFKLDSIFTILLRFLLGLADTGCVAVGGLHERALEEDAGGGRGSGKAWCLEGRMGSVETWPLEAGRDSGKVCSLEGRMGSVEVWPGRDSGKVWCLELGWDSGRPLELDSDSG